MYFTHSLHIQSYCTQPIYWAVCQRIIQKSESIKVLHSSLQRQSLHTWGVFVQASLGGMMRLAGYSVKLAYQQSTQSKPHGIRLSLEKKGAWCALHLKTVQTGMVFMEQSLSCQRKLKKGIFFSKKHFIPAKADWFMSMLRKACGLKRQMCNAYVSTHMKNWSKNMSKFPDQVINLFPNVVNEGISAAKSPATTTRSNERVEAKGHKPVSTPQTTPAPIANPSNESK